MSNSADKTMYNTRTINTAGVHRVKDTDDILNIDTSVGAIDIYLINIKNSGIISRNYALFINDIAENAATNNIRIYTSGGDKINNSVSIIVSLDGASLKITPCNQNEYIATGSIEIPSSIPTNFNVLNVRKNPQAGEYGTIEAAIAAVVAPSDTNRWLIDVGVGQFVENALVLPNYVSVKGASIQETQVFPAAATHHIFEIGVLNELSFMWLQGAGSGYAAIAVLDSGNYSQAHKITFTDCDTNILVISATQDTFFFGEYIDFNGTYSFGLRVEATNGFIAYANMENYYNIPLAGVTARCTSGTGVGADIQVLASGTESDGSANAFDIADGAGLEIVSANINGCDQAITILNLGAAPNIIVSGITVLGSATYDINIEHPLATGTIGGVFQENKIVVNQLISILSQDSVNGRLLISGGIDALYADGVITDLSTIIVEGSTMGLISGGIMTNGIGLSIDASVGYGYFMASPYTGQLKRLDWNASNLVIPANSHVFIYFNSNGVLSYNGARPDPIHNIILGRVITDGFDVYLIIQAPTLAQHTADLLSTSLKVGLGCIFGSGCIVTENATPLMLDITAGAFYLGELAYTPSAGTAFQFDYVYDSGNTIVVAQNTISNTQYDNAGVLTALTASYYAKGTIWVSTDGVNQKFFAVYPQAEYSSLLAAQTADNPSVAQFMQDAVTIVASFIIQEGNANIVQIIDERPRVGFQASGVNASADHLSLLNLDGGVNGDGNHTNMFTVNGSKAMTGDIDMGTNNIGNVGLVDGVNVSAHAARHDFNGADPLLSAAPSTIGVLNAEGIDNTYISRADHVHAHGSQSGDADHALATGANNGFMSATDKTKLDGISAGAAVASVSGTANRITSSGGTTPTIDISATFEALLGKVANPLSQFAATTSLELKGVISDETGSGALVFANAPTLVNPIVGTQAPLDNSTKAASTAYVDALVVSPKIKSGVVAFGSFAGNPKKATVTFGTAFADANYSVSIVGIDSRSWSIESVVAGSFIINSNANTAPTDNTYWSAVKHGEN